MLGRFTGLAAIGAGVGLLLGLVPWRLDLVEGAGPMLVAVYAVPAFYVLAAVGSLGIHRRQMHIRPVLAWAALAVFLAGLVIGSSSVPLSLYGGGIPNSDFLLVIRNFGVPQAVGLWVGSAVFGIAILAIGVNSRVVGLAFIIGAALAIVGPIAGDAMTDSDLLTGISRSGLVICALSWIGAGVGLIAAERLEKPARHNPPVSAAA